MRTLIFNVPSNRMSADPTAQVLVTLYENGFATIAFRPNPFCAWGPPKEATGGTWLEDEDAVKDQSLSMRRPR